jgi:hypothetical protein
MHSGDIVRFAKWEEVNIQNTRSWCQAPKTHIGILIEHDKLMQVVHVLYEGNILKIRAVFVEKAGKRDYDDGT